MTADRFTQAVRQRLRLGRLLPLGGPRDGAWISEEAAEAVLLRAAKDLPGVRLGPLRIGLADPADAHEPAVPPPPSALPPGPLRVTAEFAAALSEPLPTTAHRLRALLAAAADGLGLAVAEVDLRVTDLLDEESEPAPVRRSDAARPAEAGGGDEGRAAAAVLAVPGVARLTDLLGLAGACRGQAGRERAAAPPCTGRAGGTRGPPGPGRGPGGPREGGAGASGSSDGGGAGDRGRLSRLQRLTAHSPTAGQVARSRRACAARSAARWAS